jgi:hypothetical protein
MVSLWDIANDGVPYPSAVSPAVSAHLGGTAQPNGKIGLVARVGAVLATVAMISCPRWLRIFSRRGIVDAGGLDDTHSVISTAQRQLVELSRQNPRATGGVLSIAPLDLNGGIVCRPAFDRAGGGMLRRPLDLTSRDSPDEGDQA